MNAKSLPPMSKAREEESLLYGAKRQPFADRFPAVWIAAVLVVSLLAFSIATNFSFLNPSNVNSMFLDAAQILIMAVPMTFIMVTAGIDLSVGSILILASVVASDVMARVAGTPEQVAAFEFPNADVAIMVGILAGLGAGILAGAFNGYLIAYLNLPPFIVTLATMGAYRGIALVLTDGTNNVHVPQELQQGFGAAKGLFGIPMPVLLAVGIAIVGWFVLRYTVWGTRSLAIGSNPEGARRSGIKVRAHIFWIYVSAGVAAGIAGIIDLARFTSTSVEGHLMDNLGAISAVVLGGTSLFGGVGNMPGTVIGSLLPSVLQNGFIQLHLPPFWQPVILGLVLIAAIGYDTMRRRR